MTIYNDFDLAPVLWYKIGGKAKVVLDCKSREDILEALEYIHEHNIENVFVLGTGSNLVFPDGYFDGAIIRCDVPENPSFAINGESVTCYSGEILGDLITFALDHQLVGLEWSGGLPGTVGAAVRGNVGAFGGEIKDSVVSVEVAEYGDGKTVVKTLSNQELNFSYRTSSIKLARNIIVLTATFKLTKTNEEGVVTAREIAEKNIEYRRNRHPIEYPNCGSVFKNISNPDQVAKIIEVWPELADKVKNDWYGKVSMGYIIHKLGLAGFRVGDAQVSEKHNNFIINLGNAKSSDVRTIISEIQKRCQETFGFSPEPEVEII